MAQLSDVINDLRHYLSIEPGVYDTTEVEIHTDNGGKIVITDIEVLKSRGNDAKVIVRGRWE